MTTAPQGPRFGPDDLDDPEGSLEALAHWDELEPELLSVLAAHPRHGPRLATLRAAERWLQHQAPPARGSSRPQQPLEACPSSEDLYDFGRGPGYAQLDPHRRARIEDHVRTCAECQELVTTLAAPPPVPLDFDPLELERSHEPLAPERPASERPAGIPPVHVQPARQAVPGGLPGHLPPSPTRRTVPAGPGPRPLRAPRPWLRLAAAAGLLLIAGVAVFQALQTDGTSGPRPDPLLRGRSSEALFHPRGRMLPADSALREHWSALPRGTSFELAPVPGAEAYRVELWRAGADPFQRGERLAQGESPTPLVTLDVALAPGRYTWEAWVRENGLERLLGARDFEVAPEPALEEGLLALEAVADSEQRLARALELLDRAGFRSDARALARTLPPGALRERWLAPVPAR